MIPKLLRSKEPEVFVEFKFGSFVEFLRYSLKLDSFMEFLMIVIDLII